MRQGVHVERVLRHFESQRQAEKWAREVDYARRGNNLPLLEVRLDGVGDGWCVVNPNVHAQPEPWVKPV